MHFRSKGVFRSRSFLGGISLVASVILGPACVPAFAQSPPPAPGSQPIADAKPGDVRVLASGALLGVLKKLRSDAELAIGRPLVVEYGSARAGLRDKILQGASFEVSILPRDTSIELQEAGKLRAEGAADLGELRVAIGLRGACPADLDIRSPEGLKSALLRAKLVRYAPTGLGYPTVAKMISGLGLEGKLGDGAVGVARAPLAPNEYELSLFPESEIINDKSLRDLGPVPSPFQVSAHMEARIATSVADASAARKLVAFLMMPKVDPVFEQAGYARAGGKSGSSDLRDISQNSVCR